MKKGMVTRWKRPLAAALGALFVFGAVCGVGNALPRSVTDALPESVRDVITPITAQAGTGYAMQEGTAGIAKGDKIYFGTFPSTSYVHVNPKNTSDPYWRVLDNEKDNAGGTNAMFLLSENCWGTGGSGGDVYFDQDGNLNSGQSAPNQWQGSDAQTWCTSFYAAVFSTKEQAAIKGINKSDSVFQHNNADYFAASSNILNGDKVFFLSGEEACNSAYGFATDKDETGDNSGRVAYYGDASTTREYWWLRSPDALRATPGSSTTTATWTAATRTAETPRVPLLISICNLYSSHLPPQAANPPAPEVPER
ncbi:MAG: hypothetical protein IJQ21_04920 [Lachnospiraceae bacterium]|nr:hypothetical protein [Lachnospiraceae bacterium]